MRLDAHQHFWRYTPARLPWITAQMACLRRDFQPAELTALLDAHGVDGTIAVQACGDDTENDALLAHADACARIIGVVGWLDPRAPDLAARLDALSAQPKLCGFRHQIQDAPDPVAYLAAPDVRAGIRRIQRRGYVFDVLVHGRDLDAAARCCRACDDHFLVLDHLGKPQIGAGDFAAWRRSLEAFRDLDHVAAKLSGLVTEADWHRWTPAQLRPYLDAAFDVFGPARLMFGSDWPVCTLAADYGEVCALIDDYAGALSAAERERVFAATARRVYDLDIPAPRPADAATTTREVAK